MDSTFGTSLLHGLSSSPIEVLVPDADSEQAKLSARTLKVPAGGNGGSGLMGAEVYPICIGQGQGVDCDVLIKDGFAYVQELKEELQGGDPAMDELVEEFGKQVGYLDGMGDPTGNGSIVGTTAHIGEMDKLNQQFKKGWDELMGKQGMAATIQTLRNRHLPQVDVKPSDGKPEQAARRMCGNAKRTLRRVKWCGCESAAGWSKQRRSRFRWNKLKGQSGTVPHQAPVQSLVQDSMGYPMSIHRP